MTVYYKFLDPGGRPRWGTGTWHLPNGERPGKWMPEITDLVPGQRGYHVATIDQLIDWLGPELFEVECRGEHIDHWDMHVFGQARLVRRIDAWNDRTARLFAADCAERALLVFEILCPGDPWPRHAIHVARAFADGQATRKDLAEARAKARASASAAARDAARDVTWGAAKAAARDVAWETAKDAVWEAARVVVRAATEGPAWVAARAAAQDAAWVVARAAAGVPVRGAFRSAFWAGTWSAIWDRERAWQTRRLSQLISAGHTHARQEEP